MPLKYFIAVLSLAGHLWLSSHAHGQVAFSPGLYVTDHQQDAINHISSNGVVTRAFSVINGPIALAFKDTSTLYVGGFGGPPWPNSFGAVSVYGPSGTVLSNYNRVPTSGGFANGTWPSGIAIDSDDSVYLATWNVPSASKISPLGVVTQFSSSPVLHWSKGAQLGPDGRLFLLQGIDVVGATADVRAVDKTTGALTTMISGLDWVEGMVLDSVGNIYLSLIRSNQVIRVSNFGLGETSVVTMVSSPGALTFGPDGTLFVVSAGGGTNNTVLTVAPNANLPTLLVTNLSDVHAIAHMPGFNSSAPLINRGPLSQSVTSGSIVGLSVGAVGAVPISCQWQLNGVAIPGATNATLNFAAIQPSASGSYSVILSNSAGVATSAAAILTVLVGSGPPTITIPPSSVVTTVGATVAFSVQLAGSSPVDYQWLKDGVPIAGATSASLAFTDVQSAANGSYHVVVSNLLGTATSTPALLTVAPLLISQQPQPQVVSATSSTTFSVGVSGQGPFTYQWQLNGGDLAGANALTLTLTNVRATNAGTYTVVVGNAFGSVVSTGAVLTVQSSPTIIQQPAGLLAGYGSSPSFTVQAGGEPPLSYQWRKNGVDLPFATQPMFSIGFARTNDAGSYTVVVTNAFGAITSAPAILSVVAPVALTITNQPVSRTVLAGTNVTFSIGVSGTGPIVYQWVKNGAALPEYGPTLSLTNVTTADAGNYQAYAYNDLGSISSALAMLTVQVPPVLLTAPQPVAVGVGSNALFTGSASGVPIPGYYWLKDGVRVTNGVGYTGLATTQLIALAVSAAHAGNYFLVATNVVGAVTSPPAALTVLLPPQILTQPQSVAVSRTNGAMAWPVQFTVVATNGLSHAWFYQSGAAALPLTGQPWVTDADKATLGLPDARRTNAGGYFVVLTNLYGTTTSSVANLRVRVPASLGTNGSGPALLPGGRIRLTFGDAEGGAPSAADLANVEVQYTPSLQGTNTVWTRLPVVFTGTNGQWLVEDNAPGFALRRYYRVIER